MKVSELIKKIEKDYPLNSAYDFDNPGCNVTDVNDDIKGILVCLDVTLAAIEQARKNGASLIISHHPLTFSAYKNINTDIQGKRIRALLKNGISAYSIHTNFDVNLASGMGRIVVDRLFKKVEIKSESLLETKIIEKKKYGIGNVLTLKKAMSFSDIAKKVFSKFDIDEEKASLYPIDEKKPIKKIAILPGSGSGDVESVLKIKPDLYITGDLKHNQILDLLEEGVSYINATHYGLEKIFIEYMQRYLKSKVKCQVLTYYDYKI